MELVRYAELCNMSLEEIKATTEYRAMSQKTVNYEHESLDAEMESPHVSAELLKDVHGTDRDRIDIEKSTEKYWVLLIANMLDYLDTRGGVPTECEFTIARVMFDVLIRKMGDWKVLNKTN